MFDKVKKTVSDGEIPFNEDSLKQWLDSSYDERIESLNRASGVKTVIGDWAILECKNSLKSLIFHIPSGQFRLFLMKYKDAVYTFSKLTDEEKDKMLKEIMFE